MICMSLVVPTGAYSSDAATQAACEAPATRGERSAPAPSRSANAKIILTVDDDAAVRAAVVVQLRDLGYEVLEAESGPSALDLLERSPRIDLLFTDLVMPGGLNGKQLATLALLRRPDLKVLFTSGYAASPGNSEIRLDAGDALLSKPYRKADLSKAIQDALEPTRRPVRT